MRGEIIVLASLLAVVYCLPQPQGGGGHAPQGFFQYVNVPAHKEYEFGWNRGNEHHYISRFEQSKDHRFRTRVKWGDKDGYGEHYWEYNHGPKHKDEYKEPVHHAPAYKPPKKGYASENHEQYILPEVQEYKEPERYELVEEPIYHASENIEQYILPEVHQEFIEEPTYHASENIEVIAAPENYFGGFKIPDGYELVKIRD